MSKFINLENAHVFSKAVITHNMEAAASSNISAHTIQSKNIWAETIPFLTSDDIKNLTEDKEFIKEGCGKVKFHYRKNIYNLTNTTNNNVPSNGYVGKVILEGKPVEQFIDSTDVTDNNGNIALIYKPILYKPDGSEVYTSEYVINSSNGLIYDLKSTGNLGIFNTSNANGMTDYTLSFFTYEGKKINNILENTVDKDTWNENLKSITEHINDSDIHVNITDKNKWDTTVNDLSSHVSDNNIHVDITDKTKWNTAVNDLSSHISDNNIHVNVTDKTKWDTAVNDLSSHVTDNTRHLTTENINIWNTAANNIHTHKNDNSIHITDEERNKWNNKADITPGDINILDLNEFITNNIDKSWVQSIIKYKENDKQYVYIPYAKTYYNEQDADIDETEIEDIARHERIAEAWINDVIKNNKPKVQLVFIRDSVLTNEVIRRMFWELDINEGRDYGSDDSISKKYMKPGLVIRLNTLLSDGITNSSINNLYPLQYKKIDEAINEKDIIPTYIFQTWLGNIKNSNNENDIIWNFIDSDGTNLEVPEIGNTFNDAFSNVTNWIYDINEQSQKLVEENIFNINSEITNIKENRLIYIEHNTCKKINGSVVGALCLNIDSSYIPKWEITKIKLNSPVKSTSYLRIIIVPESANEPIERYTSINADKLEWEFKNLPIVKPASYWKLILVSDSEEIDNDNIFGDYIFGEVKYYEGNNLKAGIDGNKTDDTINRNIYEEIVGNSAVPQITFISTPYINGDTYINAIPDGNKWNLSINVQDTLDNSKSVIPTSSAVYNAIDEITSNLSDHIDDQDIHITEKSSKKWNDNIIVTNQNSNNINNINNSLKEHTSDNIIHITNSEREMWNKVSLIDELSLSINSLEDNLELHNLDKISHITAEDRERWNNRGITNIVPGQSLDQYTDNGANYLTFSLPTNTDENTTYRLNIANDLAYDYQNYLPNNTNLLDNKLVTAPHFWKHIRNNNVHLTSEKAYIPGYNFAGMFRSPGVVGYGFEFKMTNTIKLESIDIQLAFDKNSSNELKNSSIPFSEDYSKNKCVLKIFDKINNVEIACSKPNSHTPSSASDENGIYTFTFGELDKPESKPNLIKGREFIFRFYEIESDADNNVLYDENGNIKLIGEYAVPMLFHTYENQTKLDNYIHKIITDLNGNITEYNETNNYPGAASVVYINGLRTKITGFTVGGEQFAFIFDMLKDSLDYSDYLIKLVHNLYNQVNILSTSLINLQNQNNEK